MKLEICVDSLESAVNATTGGADRLELATALMLGGLTPTVGLLTSVKEKIPTSIPVFCLIRPRPGDFIFSDLDVITMKHDIEALKLAGADGFVLGVLNRDRGVDKKVMAELIAVCGPLPTTFHRAIDVCLDWRLALDNIIQLGCQRVLTSGTCQSAFEGRFLIREMIDHVGDKILIMPGAGVNADNIAEIIRITKATEYHTSASIVMKSAVDTSVKMGPADNIDIVRMTDTVKVRDIKEKLLR